VRWRVAVVLCAATCMAMAGNLFQVASAHADTGWEAVASSPCHEQIDFAWGSNQQAAEARALSQCTALERASDCRRLASGPTA